MSKPFSQPNNRHVKFEQLLNKTKILSFLNLIINNKFPIIHNIMHVPIYYVDIYNLQNKQCKHNLKKKKLMFFTFIKLKYDRYCVGNIYCLSCNFISIRGSTRHEEHTRMLTGSTSCK